MVSVKTAAAATTAESMMTTSGSKSRKGGDDEWRIRSGGEGTGEVVYLLALTLLPRRPATSAGQTATATAARNEKRPYRQAATTELNLLIYGEQGAGPPPSHAGEIPA